MREANPLNKKLIRGFRTNTALFVVCFVLFVILMTQYSPALALIEALLAALVLYISIRRNVRTRRAVRQYFDRVGGGMDTARSNNMLYTPLPMLVFDVNTEEILWGNEKFVELSDLEEKLYETALSDVIPDFKFHWLLEDKRECPVHVVWNHRTYRVFGTISRTEGERGGHSLLATTYWMDITDTEEMRNTLEMTRPVVAILMVDNYEDLMAACPEAKRSALLAELEGKLNDWCGDTGALLLGYDRDRYLFAMEEKDFLLYAEQKFDLLDTIRTVESSGVAATLSIGVGREEESFAALFKNAELALEMALSRGGDQAVVKNKANFEFYGGRAKTTERRTKVKSRVMASALRELMQESGNVYVMGHKYADMDSLGAAVGICCMARKLGKKAQIVMDTENNAVHPVLNKLLKAPEYAAAFVNGDVAFLHAQNSTLLVVVDTNRPDSVESEALLESCNRVAVIDHHRRGSRYIDKMTFNYHEPYASSASELVTELMQYMVEPADVLRCEAEALLSGIVLDTKNFTNRTGGRTFEAAGYLRRIGADTQDVQRMFQTDLSATLQRHEIMRQAEIYHGNMAVVISEETYDRVTAAKAADELLTIRGVDASFVIYTKDDGIYMSARSLGEINVQVILEALGGGGNSTTAGGQVSGMTAPEAKEKLLAAIESYLND